eukprot:scaffold66535_cov40-Attheya_sp.AAC.2
MRQHSASRFNRWLFCSLLVPKRYTTQQSSRTIIDTMNESNHAIMHRIYLAELDPRYMESLPSSHTNPDSSALLYSSRRRVTRSGGSSFGKSPNPMVAREQSIYDETGAIKREQVDWDSKSYHLPVHPPSHADKTLKHNVLTSTIDVTRTHGGSKNWNTRAELLISRFGFNNINAGATGKLSALSNLAGGPCYEYVFIRVLGAAAQTNINRPANGITANFMNNAKYLELQVTAKPILALPLCTNLEDRVTTTAILALPLEADGTLSLMLNAHHFQQPMGLIHLMMATQQPLECFSKVTSSYLLTNSYFKEWLEKAKVQVKFEVAAFLLKPSYVGEGIIESTSNRLHQCQQNSRDSFTTSTMKINSITQHFLNFSNILSEMQGSPENPTLFTLDVTEVFYHSLSCQIKEALKTANYAVPATAPTNKGQMDSIILLRDAAPTVSSTPTGNP